MFIQSTAELSELDILFKQDVLCYQVRPARQNNKQVRRSTYLHIQPGPNWCEPPGDSPRYSYLEGEKERKKLRHDMAHSFLIKINNGAIIHNIRALDFIHLCK